MAEKAIPAEEVKDGKEQKPEALPAKADEKKETPKGGQALSQLAGEPEKGEKQDDEKDPKEGLIVELKKEGKEQKKLISELSTAVKTLREDIKKGSLTRSEARDELDELAEKYEVDPAFVKELSGLLLEKSQSNIKKDIDDLKQNDLQERTRKAKAGLESEFDRVIKANPELAKVAKKDVVVKYIQNVVLKEDKNSVKTMSDVLEDLYGIEPSSIEGYDGNAKNAPDKEDMKKPSDESFKRMASKEGDTEEKDEYFDGLLERAGMAAKRKK